jgi:hypothetical protein
MSYNQGTGNLQRSKGSFAVTAGSSNGAASVSTTGTRFDLAVTLNGNLANNGTIGPITINNPDIKESSVIESCIQTNAAFSQFDIYDVQDGSCKSMTINYTGGTIPNGTVGVFSVMIYN